jgi:hypothetical protein
MLKFGSPLRSFVVLALAVAALAVPARLFAQAPTFSALVQTPVTVGSGFPDDATVGDINGDGKLDAMIPGINGLRMLLGNGDGTFVDQVSGMADVTSSNVVNLPLGLMGFLPRPIGGIGGLGGGIKTVDVNLDGKLDLVSVTSAGINFTNYSFVSVLINSGVNDANGVPQFTTTHHWMPVLGVRPVTVGDLNGDTWPDFIIGTCCNGIQVWTSNSGNGSFTPGQTFSLTPGVGGPAVGQGVIADLNGDGRADYVVSSDQNGGANIFFGNGNGTLQTPGTFLPNGAASVAVADVNGDGRPDLLMGNKGLGSEGLYVYLNSGGGAFGAPALTAIPGFSTNFSGGCSVVVADMNGDGNLDAVLSNTNSNSIAVLRGDGNGGFNAPDTFPASTFPTFLFVGDFTGDGKLDIGVDLRNSRAFGVLTNTTVFANPATMFFTDALTGSTSPNLATIPAGKYGYTPSGLQRLQSSSTTDRPMVTTALGTYLTASNFTAEVTLNLSSPDLAYFGFGRTEPDPLYFNEPTPSFLFRVHRNWTGYSGIQAWPTTFATGFNDPSHFFGFPAGNSLPDYGGGSLTLMITKDGDTLTMSIPGMGASKTFSISQYSAAMGLNGTNARIFFGNTSAGSVFSDLKIYESLPDTTPPVISGPGDISMEATGPGGAEVTFTATAEDDVDGPVDVEATPPSGSLFAIGDTTVDLSAVDAAGNDATASFTVTVEDTTPPVITSVSGDLTAEATSAAGAIVSYAAAAATDAVGVVSITYSHASGATFPIGATTVTVTATDAAGNASSAEFVVTVHDTTAPAIGSVTPSQATLWPPNHQMVAIDVAAAATDAVGVTSLKIIAVASSEPDNGLGDGDTAGDAVITGPLSVNLRAERGGKGAGRTYTITVEARDAAGNTSTKTCTVFVPKSKGK